MYEFFLFIGLFQKLSILSSMVMLLGIACTNEGSMENFYESALQIDKNIQIEKKVNFL